MQQHLIVGCLVAALAAAVLALRRRGRLIQALRRLVVTLLHHRREPHA
jgi:hypothetical protein